MTAMAEAIRSFTFAKPHLLSLSPRPARQWQSIRLPHIRPYSEDRKNRRTMCRVNAVPDLPLMAVLVQHMEGQRDIITNKVVWHLSDQAIKNVYIFYIMFTCWGCLFFGSTKDPYYDSEAYRKDGGDGTGHWVYNRQEDIEESARAQLWREELIEEIEQKVGGLRELEEAGRK